MPMQTKPLLAVRPQWPHNTGSGAGDGFGAACDPRKGEGCAAEGLGREFTAERPQLA